MIDDILKVDPNEVESAFSAVVIPDPGIYAAKLADVREVIARSGLTGTELTFEITEGEYAGVRVKDTLWHSLNRKVEMRHALFAHRLGLTRVVDGKYRLTPGKRTFADCIGTPVLIDIRIDEYQRADGSTGRRAVLSFEGILLPTDSRVVKAQEQKPEMVAEKPESEIEEMF